MSVPVERKENMIYPQREGNEASHSASSSFPRMFSRTNTRRGLLRIRGKRDASQKRAKAPDVKKGTKSSSNFIGKLKSDMVLTQSKIESPKRMRVSTSFHQSSESDRLKLKEICFVKQNLSKKVIAKFISQDLQKEHDDDDNLVVAWDNDCAPKILTEPSTSTRPPSRALKTTSYITTKIKRPKNTLRRLTTSTNDATGKVDKLKKRKKLKPTKILWLLYKFPIKKMYIHVQKEKFVIRPIRVDLVVKHP